jgi:hypothetical protein
MDNNPVPSNTAPATLRTGDGAPIAIETEPSGYEVTGSSDEVPATGSNSAQQQAEVQQQEEFDSDQAADMELKLGAMYPEGKRYIAGSMADLCFREVLRGCPLPRVEIASNLGDGYCPFCVNSKGERVAMIQNPNLPIKTFTLKNRRTFKAFVELDNFRGGHFRRLLKERGDSLFFPVPSKQTAPMIPPFCNSDTCFARALIAYSIRKDTFFIKIADGGGSPEASSPDAGSSSSSSGDIGSSASGVADANANAGDAVDINYSCYLCEKTGGVPRNVYEPLRLIRETMFLWFGEHQYKFQNSAENEYVHILF